MSVRFAFYVPAGLSDSIKKTLIPAMEKAIKAPEVGKVIHDLGAIADFVPGPEFKKMMTEEYEMVKKYLRTGTPAGN
jgi:tripartite-type tricarboxylate transporter receptor subunit TctC